MKPFKSLFLVALAILVLNCNGITNKSNDDEDGDSSSLCDPNCQSIKNELKILQVEQKSAISEGNVDQAVGVLIKVQLLREALSEDDLPSIESIDQSHTATVNLLHDENDQEPICPAKSRCAQLQPQSKLYRDLRELHLNSHRLVQLSLNLEVNSRTEASQIQELPKKRQLIVNSLRDVGNLLGVRSYIDFSWPNCPKVTAAWCDDLGESLQKSRIALLRAAKQDPEAAAGIQLDINKVLDYLELGYQGIGPESDEFELVKNRYAGIFDPRTTPTLQNQIPIYTEEEKNAVDKTMRDFGNLYIEETPVVNGANQFVHAKANQDMPWSGYWYPVRKNEIFAQHDAPIQKFDRILMTLGRAQGAVEWEENRFDPNDAHWAGLCDAWSIASLVTEEPRKSVELAGEIFQISDIKALAIKKYQQFAFDNAALGSSKIYGNRYFGNDESDGRLQDIRPEAFHRIATVMLRDRQTAFGIDDDSGPEVWNKPIFEMRWRIEKDPKIGNAFIVTATPTLTVNRFSISDELTEVFNDSKAPRFRYRLYVDQNDQKSEGSRVIAGEWIEKSRNIHPDTIFVVDQKQKSTPENPLIADNLDLIDELIARAR